MTRKKLVTLTLATTLVIAGVVWLVHFSCRVKQVSFGAIGEIDPVVSPDGRWLAFRSFRQDSPDKGELRVMAVASGYSDSKQLLAPDQFHGGTSWAPNSDWISYTSFGSSTPGVVSNQVFKVNVSTGEKVQLTHGADPELGEFTSWGPNEEIAFISKGDIYAVTATGGTIRKLVSIRSQNQLLAPEQLVWSPDGRRIVFVSGSSAENDLTSLWVAELNSGRIEQLTAVARDHTPVWKDSTKIIFARELARDAQLSLFELNLGSKKIVRLTNGRIDYSPSFSPQTGILFFSRSQSWSLQGNDFGFFRGFHIFRITPHPWLRFTCLSL